MSDIRNMVILTGTGINTESGIDTALYGKAMQIVPAKGDGGLYGMSV